jgi:hypothetical protein
MKLVEKNIKLAELQEMSQKMFGNLVKGVVDIQKGSMAVDAELHSDEEAFLLENGSKQEDLWGINIYPEFFGQADFIEFDSMINLRPSQKNRSRGVDDPEIRKKILELTSKLILK